MIEPPQNLAKFYVQRARLSGPDRAILYRGESGWESMSYSEWIDRARAVAQGLHAMGLEPGTPVMMLGRPTLEFMIVSWAVALVGGVLVPIHPTSPARDVEEAIALVKPGFLFLADPSLFARLRDSVSPLAGRTALLCGECIVSDARSGSRPYLRLEDVVTSREELVSLEQLEAHGQVSPVDIERLTDGQDGDAPAMIIFTAGTVGDQKGVVLSHSNLLFQARTLSFLLPLSQEDAQLLFLPLSHILGVISYLSSVASGTPLALGGGMRSLLEDLRDVGPTFMVGVPRVYEKIVEKLDSFTAEFSTIWWEVFRRGIEAGRKVQEAVSEGRKPDLASRAQLQLARRTVFQRCREMFGGRMRFLVSGGAPLPEDVAHTIMAFGIPVLDGFGLTETSGATHLNRLDSVGIGTVGPALPMVQTRISPDGEILVKGPGLMQGYLDDPEATRSVVDDQGWLHTGDLGELDGKGRLCITGRRKNIIVTATGKNILPTKIEAELHTIPLVSHCLVAGDGRPFLCAVFTVGASNLAEWAAQRSILYDNVEKLRTDVRLYREIETQLEKVNGRLAPHERVRKFAILDSDFSQAAGELTHDFKLRRRVVFERYGHVIEMLYKERF